MKKIILSIAAAAVFSFAANAQISVNAGYLQDDIRIGGFETGGACITLKGFQLGASYNYDFPFGLGIEAGLNFAKESRDLIIDSEGTIDAYAITLPVLFNIKHELSTAVKLLAYAGPEFRYFLDVKMEADGEKNSFYKDTEDDEKILGHFEARAAAGIGVLLFDQIRIDAGYRLGLNNFAAKNARDEGARIHTNGFYVGASYILPLKF